MSLMHDHIEEATALQLRSNCDSDEASTILLGPHLPWGTAVRLGGRYDSHEPDTDNTAGKAKKAHFHFVDAAIALKRKDLLPENANREHSDEEGVPSPAMHDWLFTEGRKKANDHTAGRSG